jgi:hypothetical protein
MVLPKRFYWRILQQRQRHSLVRSSCLPIPYPPCGQRFLTTAPVVGAPSPAAVKEGVENVDYPTLLQEYNLVQDQVRFFTLQLYRRILRSIHRLLRPGNAFDESEFRKREEKQQNFQTAAKLSMVDTLPIDREEELQSRMDYYWQYAREHFTQHSDALQDILAPSLRASTINPSSSSISHNSNKSARDADARHREREAELLLQDQYDAIERYFYLLQQGEVHRQWLLRDMKFPKDPYKPTPDAAAQVTKFKGQFQQYIVRVLQYKYQLPAHWSKGLLDVTTSTEDNATQCGDELLIWSDEEDEDM